MIIVENIFGNLASLFDYPNERYQENLNSCLEQLQQEVPKAGEVLQEFVHSVKNLKLSELEENYTQTFDLNPQCSLEVGWHLFGENYSRGTFLVKMRKDLKEYGIEESNELPDHLTHVLSVLGRMPTEEAKEFAQRFIYLALYKMLKGFEKKENCFYQRLFHIVQITVEHYFGEFEGEYPKEEESEKKSEG